jgi:hypothetical protein
VHVPSIAPARVSAQRDLSDLFGTYTVARSKRTSRRSSPKRAWEVSSCAIVFRALHAIPVPAAFMTPHIYPSLLQTAVPRSNAGDRVG